MIKMIFGFIILIAFCFFIYAAHVMPTEELAEIVMQTIGFILLACFTIFMFAMPICLFIDGLEEWRLKRRKGFLGVDVANMNGRRERFAASNNGRKYTQSSGAK